jgi:predicted nucleic acid-binding protein
LIRIRLETEAVQLILSHVRAGSLSLVVSPVHDAEIVAINDLAERSHLQMMLQQIGHRVPPDPSQARLRAEALVQQGLGPADAAHLAYAGQVGADFVTCDDRLIRQCRRVKLGIWFGTPIAFCDKEDLR